MIQQSNRVGAAAHRRRRMVPAIATVASLLAGCAGGPIGYPPPVTDPASSAEVTFYRDGSWVGFPAHIHLALDGTDLYLLGRNESYTLRLDPGEYIVDFDIGFNECRNGIIVYPGHSYRYRLVPNCYMEREPVDYRPAPAPAARSSGGTPRQGPGSTSYDLIYGD